MAMILNDEQNMLKETAKDFCAKNVPRVSWVTSRP